MYRLFFYIFTIAVVALSSCGRHQGASSQEDGDTLRMKYARQLSIVRYHGYAVASVADPWHEGKTLHRYVLVTDSVDLGKAHLPEGTVVRVPLKRSVVFTTVHSSLLISLGAQKVISGVCDLRYIDIPWIQEECRAGRIRNCGSGMAPDIEKIIDTKPDAILLSPFENSGGYGKLEEVNIPLIECADYMEPSPLGRAEWMRFFGLLTGREREADSLFHVVESRYMALKDKVAHVSKRPSVLIDKKNGSVWYVPGGQSTMGQIVKDAGGSYAFASEAKSGSLSLPFEQVIDRAGKSDIWLLRYSTTSPLTYAQLAAEYGGYREIQAFKDRQVYGCNTQTSRFYEESPFRPDFLLGDFISIIHPEVKGVDAPRYYFKLK